MRDCLHRSETSGFFNGEGSAMNKTIGIGMVGYKFMGKAHSNAYLSAPRFFELPVTPVMRAVCGRTRAGVEALAAQWGWESVETDYRRLIRRDDIGLVDVATPNNTHYKITMAALKARKHVACEKPLAITATQAHEMACAAREARVLNTVWFNYRRCPAVGLARQIVAEGRLGTLYHVRAIYLQDWIADPAFPLVWRMQKRIAGSGAHGDLNAHIIDLTRFITGLEFQEVSGLAHTFIKERPLLGSDKGDLRAKARRGKGRVTVDDTVLFLARLERNVVASFEATRFAPGRRNHNRIEINGSKGSLAWCFEQMNELEFYSSDDPQHLQGFRTIQATEACHPYAGAYWPAGHPIGYEHTFVNQVADIMKALPNRRKVPPDFVDGLRCQEVMDAVLQSCARKRWVSVKRRKV